MGRIHGELSRWARQQLPVGREELQLEHGGASRRRVYAYRDRGLLVRPTITTVLVGWSMVIRPDGAHTRSWTVTFWLSLLLMDTGTEPDLPVSVSCPVPTMRTCRHCALR